MRSEFGYSESWSWIRWNNSFLLKCWQAWPVLSTHTSTCDHPSYWLMPGRAWGDLSRTVEPLCMVVGLSTLSASWGKCWVCVCVCVCVSSEDPVGHTGRKVPATVPAVALLHLLMPFELKSCSSQKAANTDTSARLQLALFMPGKKNVQEESSWRQIYVYLCSQKKKKEK